MSCYQEVPYLLWLYCSVEIHTQLILIDSQLIESVCQLALCYLLVFIYMFCNIVLEWVCDLANKIQQCACIKFFMKLNKYSVKTFKMFYQTFERILFIWVLVQDDEYSSWTITSKIQENMKNIINLSMRMRIITEQ